MLALLNTLMSAFLERLTVRRKQQELLRLNTIVKDGFQGVSQSAYRVLLVLLSAMIYTKQTANCRRTRSVAGTMASVYFESA